MPEAETKVEKPSESLLLTSLLRSAVQHGSIYLVGMVGLGLAQFFILPIYARIFSTAQYGLLSLAIVLISLGGPIIGNWLTSCTTRFLPYYQKIHKTDTFYSTILLSMIFSLAAFLLLSLPAYFLLRGFVDVEFRTLLTPIIIVIPLNMALQISLTILRVRQEAKKYITFQLSFTCVSLIIGVLMAVYLGLGVSGILWGQVIMSFILGAILFKGLFLTGSSVSLTAMSLPSVKGFALYGFPAAATTIGTWILTGADRYVIEYFRSTAEVGLYSMGYAVSNVVMLLIHAFMLAEVPIVMLTYESSNREITARLLSHLTRIFILITLPATVGILVLASPAIRLLTTPDYYPASVVIPYVALGNFIYGLSLLSYTGLMTARKTPIMAGNWFAAAALNIVLNIIFVPKFGFIAAAVTTLASYVVLLILNIKFATKYLEWVVIPRSAFNSVLASIIMGGAVFGVIQISSYAIVDCVLGVIIGSAVYIGMLLLLREFSQGEISQVKSLVKDSLPWRGRS